MLGLLFMTLFAPQPEPPDTGRVTYEVFRHAEGERPYRLVLPAETRGRPLVVVLHGCTQDARDVAQGTRMDRASRERGVAVLYPEQPAAENPSRCWNWYEPAHQGRNAGEPALLAGMIRHLVQEHELDPDRIHVAGISAGGAMALTLAATHPELMASAASHSGIAFGAARDVDEAVAVMAGGEPSGDPAERLLEAMGERRRLVPLLVLHGDEDPVVSPENAYRIVDQWTALVTALPGTEARWDEDAPDALPPGIAMAGTLRTGDGAPALRLLLVEGLGHAWSGGSEKGTFTRPEGPDATRLILEFFLDGPGTPRGASP